MNAKEQLKLLFSTENSNIRFEVANLREDGTFTIRIPEVAAEDRNYVERVLNAYGFVPVPELISSEIASHGGLEYSNHPDLVEAAFDSEQEDEAGENEEIDDEGEEVEMASMIATQVVNQLTVLPNFKALLGANSRAEIARGIDTISDDTKLKVIGNPEMMKFADKVFNMISPGEDKSNYAAFLYNFDDFLLMHQPDTEYTNTDEEEADTPATESASAIENMEAGEIAKFINLFGDIHTASVFLSDFKDYLPVEIAKGKNARSALLSAMMKGMSGEAGLQAVAAWEAGDAEKLEGALSTVVKHVVGKLGGA